MYIRSKHFGHVFDGQTGILLDLQHGTFFGVNSSSVHLWKCFDARGTLSREELTDALVTWRPVSAYQASCDVDEFLKLLLAKGALRTTSHCKLASRTADSEQSTSRFSDSLPPAAIPHAFDLRTQSTLAGGTLALLLLGIMRILVACRFGSLYLAVKKFPTNRALCPRASTVDWAYRCIESAALFIPHHAWCLERSAALTIFLRCFGVPAKFCIGCRVAPFAAHAWVEVGSEQLGERDDLHTYYLLLRRC